MHEAELLICPKCGNPREVCSDPSRPWYPQRTICHATKSLAAVERKYHEKHKGWKPNPRQPFGPHDGVTLWVSEHDLTPDDHFI